MKALRLLALASLVVCAAPVRFVQAADVPQQQSSVRLTLNTQSVGPRDMEDLTARSIERSYSAAWEELSNALEQNQPSLLDAHFTGFARDNFAQRIADQKKLGLHTRFLDRGHKATAVLYPADGLSIQLRDEAHFELQVYDGDKLLSAQDVTRHYIVVLTPAETSWKVRILQAVTE